MDEKIKTWTLRFPAKENPNMEKALTNRVITMKTFINTFQTSYYLQVKKKFQY